MRGALLNVEGLRVAYGAVTALDGVSLALGSGEFVALLGPSGCGKTSLLRAVAGFVHPAAGRILLNGADIAAVPPRGRNIGIVYQSYALFPHMSAAENVRFGLDSRGVPRAAAHARVAEALAMVGLETLAARRPHQLSGGQQQRVALARALVIAPDLLLLDEPLAALDKQLRVQMQTELRALQRRLGITTVFVTHDREEAFSMADRVAVLRDGRICQIDTPERLFAGPVDAWVAEFIGAGNVLAIPAEPEPGVAIAWPAGRGLAFIPHDRIALAPAETGPRITARRFLGLGVELHVQTRTGILRAVLSAAAPFAIGDAVRVTVATADCRILPPG
ncbi:MAG: ABC transporter ATP-binding protein [Alphaproteobacteria bacterium]|nr:ABC transporter ATP-binding protein [Alphaproteobacteria bacterium]